MYIYRRSAGLRLRRTFAGAAAFWLARCSLVCVSFEARGRPVTVGTNPRGFREQLVEFTPTNHTGVCEKNTLFCKPLPCNQAAETAIRLQRYKNHMYWMTSNIP